MSGKRECGVCWAEYDPEAGDDVWQVPAGTAFDDLPADWRCPRCDSPKSRFLPPREELTADPRPEMLEAAYRKIQQTKMSDVPLLNPALKVKAVDFQPFEGGLLGALVTPWGINAVYFPPPGTTPAPWQGRMRALPAGVATFLPQELEGIGEVELLSLFSPALEFVDQAAAVATARTALELLRAPPEPADSDAPKNPTRRDLLSLFRGGHAA